MQQKALGLEHVIGSIGDGKVAIFDFKNKSLERLTAYKEIELIIREGEIVRSSFVNK